MQYDWSKPTVFQGLAPAIIRFFLERFCDGSKTKDFCITYSLMLRFRPGFPQLPVCPVFALWTGRNHGQQKNFKMTLGLRFDLPTYPDVSGVITHPARGQHHVCAW